MDIKRFFDLFVAVTLLVVTLPLQCLILIGIFVTMGSPVFFLQERPGRFGKPFMIIKFRTMVTDDAKGPHSTARITRFGSWLRRMSLDELPELYNVITGKMSMVGPRPLLLEYMPLYNIHQARRHEVRPGLTGLAQVRGRNLLSWEEKFEYDVFYVDNRSMWLDVKILLLTALQIFRTNEVNQDSYVTTEPFRGNDAREVTLPSKK